ncbi:hypothetical protein I5370_21770 [Citrobacter sp. FDAARGOS_156]|uniref:Uncharacterized protein n=1 Tax=Citrobacter pasteurii TaxID=1563222 RepID=A0ABX8KEB4_9ENTR|nr:MULTISPECIES: hypothetical protein [Citrobacter]MBJ8742651.1 hypothetical protein [Citrobacter sp. FDAARGOS_156]QXA47267.1 hypothetical protein I6L54_10565 [Citrobacter pasteurii]CEJ64024.1 hypothetical protein [Citrobacter pasteurii]
MSDAIKVLNYDHSDPDKMRLPKGSSCGNCYHIRRCKAMFGHTETDIYCDWSPSRFIPVKTEVAAAGIDVKPAIGQRTGKNDKTHWIIFVKDLLTTI